MAITKFNVNDYIRFEPNENTRDCVRRFYRNLHNRQDVEDDVNWFMNSHTKIIDGKPVMRIQFHEFASTFGYYMIMGSRPLIKDNDIYFETADDDSKARLLAEFENFRRRTEKEKADLVTTANNKLLGQLTEVYDDFDRAFERPLWGTSAVEFAQGIKQIFTKFKKIMSDNGVAQFDPMGEPFDPAMHEALIRHPTDLPEGTVASTVQKGYMANGKILQHAKVVVSSGKVGNHHA